MEKKDCSKMSNNELKLYQQSINNEFDAKRSQMLKMCAEMEQLQRLYNLAEEELKIRRNLY